MLNYQRVNPNIDELAQIINFVTNFRIDPRTTS